ncbi:hypothetical protein PpBr36_03796, partial [Pyricularia pennisetigena]|uniref:hypothetical protein n=1 Tax=Pyricularia pennisetigena TaxID=1578925 RepID=UPI00115404C8
GNEGAVRQFAALPNIGAKPVWIAPSLLQRSLLTRSFLAIGTDFDTSFTPSVLALENTADLNLKLGSCRERADLVCAPGIYLSPDANILLRNATALPNGIENLKLATAVFKIALDGHQKQIVGMGELLSLAERRS